MTNRVASRAKTMEAKAIARLAECRAAVEYAAQRLALGSNFSFVRLLAATERYHKALATVRRYQRKNKEAKE